MAAPAVEDRLERAGAVRGDGELRVLDGERHQPAVEVHRQLASPLHDGAAAALGDGAVVEQLRAARSSRRCARCAWPIRRGLLGAADELDDADVPLSLVL